MSTAVFVLVNAVLLRSLPYPTSDRLVEVRHAAPTAELAVTGLPAGTFLHYRGRNRAFKDIRAYLEHVLTLTDGADAPEQVQAALVSPNFFPVLRATPHLGRFPTTADSGPCGRRGLFIGYDLWVRRYGADPGIVGRTVEIDRRREVVVGVAQPGFYFPDPKTQMWIGWPPEELLTAIIRISCREAGLSAAGCLRSCSLILSRKSQRTFTIFHSLFQREMYVVHVAGRGCPHARHAAV